MGLTDFEANVEDDDFRNKWYLYSSKYQIGPILPAVTRLDLDHKVGQSFPFTLLLLSLAPKFLSIIIFQYMFAHLSCIFHRKITR